MQNKNPAKRALLGGLCAGAAACIAGALCYHLGGFPWGLGLSITGGVAAYHMLARFLAAPLASLFSSGRCGYTHWWFSPKPWEGRLYRALGVKKWKSCLLTYSPDDFSLKKHAPAEIVRHMCHAELVHEFSALLSLLSVAFAIPFGDAWLFCLTALLSAGVELPFIAVQRYNRPRMVRLMGKRPGRANP